MVAGSQLTLICLPDPILQEAVQCFMPTAEEHADGVYVASWPLKSRLLEAKTRYTVFIRSSIYI